MKQMTAKDSLIDVTEFALMLLQVWLYQLRAGGGGWGVCHAPIPVTLLELEQAQSMLAKTQFCQSV